MDASFDVSIRYAEPPPGRVSEVPPERTRVRERAWQIVQVCAPGDRASRIFDVSIMLLIALNVLAVIIETVPWVSRNWGPYLFAFEVASVVVFCGEYVVRLWACVEDERYARPILGRLRYMFSGMALIDLLAIAPFFVPMFITVDLRIARILRLFRLLRLLKLARYSESMQLLTRVLSSRREELMIVLIAEVVLILMVAPVMYFIEHEAQPEVFSSIPASMWWAVVTLTTVGYGDISPVTGLGKVCAGILAFLGIALFALPAGIVASGFTENVRTKRHMKAKCFHCGRHADDVVSNANTVPAPPSQH